VPVVQLPEVPYDATAQRPAWPDLPAAVRAAIEERLGGPVLAATPATSGFTTGFAAVLETPGAGRAFVKAADLDHLVDAYRREAAVTRALPADVPAPRPRWTARAGDWYIVCFEPVDGHVPPMPWRPAELDATLEAWARAAAALTDPPAALLAVGLSDFSELVDSAMMVWREVAGGRGPLPPVPCYALTHLDELAELEAAAAGYARGSTGVLHCDLRLDNVLIDRQGAAWLCDWNWICRGPAWFDTAVLLVTAYASGLDADRRFAAHPTALRAPADALDAALATIAGFWLRQSARPADAAASLAAHQRWSGTTALAWLAQRRGWDTSATGPSGSGAGPVR
jgi:aminoglycoside phosphotransferase (APT) family kinase protein